MRRVIPPELHAEVLTRAATGASSVEISDWLRTEHQVVASDRAVRTLLHTHRDFRASVTQVVATDKLAPLVTSDLDELDAIRQRVRQIEVVATLDKKYGIALKAADLQAKILCRKLEFSGVGGASEPSLDVRENLIAKLARFVGD